MKYFVLEKTRYILNNSWLGLLIPAGVHQLINQVEKTTEKQSNNLRQHPAESKISRSVGSKVRP
jgi:hypothetical protein